MATDQFLTELKLDGQPKSALRPSPRGDRSSARGEAKRDDILSRLILSLKQGEFRNPTLREIARMLQVEASHILYYFGSREELLQEVIRRWDGEKEDKAISATEGFTLDSFYDRIKANIEIPGVVHLYLTFAAEAVDTAHPAHLFFRNRFGRMVDLIAAAIVDEQGQGAISGDLDARIQARRLIALADGLQLQSLVDPRIDAASDLAAAIGELRATGTRA
jgi:AcrR family transcriptional regulator